MGEGGVSVPKSYGYRNRILRELGFSTYQDYLSSGLWRSIRRRVIERDNGKCYGCGKKARQVHHLSYGWPSLTGESLEQLVSVCRKCHAQSEFKRRRKLSLNAANSRLNKIRKKRLRRKPKKKRRRGVMCWCGINRRYHGGPCPPCLERGLWADKVKHALR